MRIRRALRKAWVRVLVVLTCLIVAVGLLILVAALDESGHEALSRNLFYVPWFIFWIAIFFGPAWVSLAFRAPTPPRNDGPPRGGIVPFRARTPDRRGSVGAGEDRSDVAARTAAGRPIGPRGSLGDRSRLSPSA